MSGRHQQVVIMFGPPGAGKGTQSSILADKLGIPHLSTGAMFRHHISNATELGREAKSYLDKGQLVPDDITVGMLAERIKQDDCAAGFILDGFPRTVFQAKTLDNLLNVRNVPATNVHVVALVVPDDVIIQRQSGRRVAHKSGKIYHLEHNPPKIAGVCDVSGEPLVQRDDDKPEVVTARLKVYHAQTEPLLEHYKGSGTVITVDGTQPMDAVTAEIINKLEQ